ncbi:MAG: TolC family protein, partial [Polyangiaceae bacterium]|nr:TolC family protein [Polyangiaceae bacterium]
RFVDRTEREYAAGESSLLVRLDAERARAEIRRAHVAALAELSRATLRLARAVGAGLGR